LEIAFQNIVGTAGLGQTGRDIQSPLATSYRHFSHSGFQLTSSQGVEIGGAGLGHYRGDSARLLRLYHLDWGNCWVSSPNSRSSSRPERRSAALRQSLPANTVANADDVAYAIACVTVFGSVAMFAYPNPRRCQGLGLSP